jgi:hypothetical protein
MTLPVERYRAVLNVESFLLDLCGQEITPGVPSVIRQEAARLLKHYPTRYEMVQAAKAAPNLFSKEY